MITCLIYLLIWVIVAVIVLYIIEVALGAVIALPSPVYILIRCLVALLILLWVLSCVGLLPGAPFGGAPHDLRR